MKIKCLQIVFLAIALSIASLSAQENPHCYRITLTDKNNSPYSIDNPSAYLSDRAIAKRARFNIAITEQDLPVNPQYIQQVCAVDSHIKVLTHSKWNNTVTIYCPDSTKLTEILSLSFVNSFLPVANYYLVGDFANAVPVTEPNPVVTQRGGDSIAPFDYGYGYSQIALHHGDFLHNEGFRGDSMLIVMLDAGWNGVDTLPIFAPLFENGQILGTRDLMPWSQNVFQDHSHGTICFSTMGTKQETLLVGTAPNASYYFIRSEAPTSEQLIEEDFWAQGAEIADSLGADVVSSSLGYTEFDQFPQGNFTYADMDGVTSVASRAATILGQKGVVVCVSAGNEGSNEWHYIGHPGDAMDILTVGAANADGNIAAFSSFGPTYDGRVKPDVTSVGWNTACIWPDGAIGTANGTSLACPVLAGLCACLWQAMPEASAQQIMQYVRESGSCYSNPNDSLGYGIPDFYNAYSQHVAVPSHTRQPNISVFPNPATDVLNILNPDLQIVEVELFTPSGTMLRKMENADGIVLKMKVQDLPHGLYIGRVRMNDGRCGSFKMVKR